MAFVETIPDAQAAGEVRRMYDRQANFFGYLPNYATVFSARPEVMPLWAHLQAGIKANLQPRLYELITLVAAYEMRSSYCCLAHSCKLLAEFTVAEIRSIVTEDGVGILTVPEVAVVRHVRLVARHADRITQDDVRRLRFVGFSDAQVFDITAAAAARAFFTKLVDGLGAEPDRAYASLDPALIETMSVGRPIERH